MFENWAKVMFKPSIITLHWLLHEKSRPQCSGRCWLRLPILLYKWLSYWNFWSQLASGACSRMRISRIPQNIKHFIQRYATRYAFWFTTLQNKSYTCAHIFAIWFTTLHTCAHIFSICFTTLHTYAHTFAMCDIPSGPPYLRLWWLLWWILKLIDHIGQTNRIWRIIKRNRMTLFSSIRFRAKKIASWLNWLLIFLKLTEKTYS